MYGYGTFYNFLDPTFLLVIAGLVFSGLASAYVNSTFRKYDEFRSSKGVTGTQAAEYILRSQGITDVGVQQIAGNLTDNYNSGNKLLSLSEATAQSTSVAAIGVAAHECGHAVQDAKNYFPLKLRAAIVPVANIGSTLSFPLIMLGVIMSWNQTLINIGILAFSLALVFQLVTLPVEFDGSRRTGSRSKSFNGSCADLCRSSISNISTIITTGIAFWQSEPRLRTDDLSVFIFLCSSL